MLMSLTLNCTEHGKELIDRSRIVEVTVPRTEVVVLAAGTTILHATYHQIVNTRLVKLNLLSTLS